MSDIAIRAEHLGKEFFIEAQFGGLPAVSGLCRGWARTEERIGPSDE
jgi:hypothetical protein